MRQIVVDGRTYNYSVGKGYTKIHGVGAEANWKLAGLDHPDDFDRGQWKQTSDGMITPAMIERYIRGKEA